MAVYWCKKTERWVVDLVWKDPTTGIERRLRRTAKDEKGNRAASATAAEKAENRLRTGLATGKVSAVRAKDDQPADARAEAEVPTVATYQIGYLADVALRLKPQTVDGIRRIYRTALLPTLGPVPLDRIDVRAVTELTRTLKERELSAKSINNALSALRAMLAHAAEHEVIAVVPKFKWQKAGPSKFDYFDFEEAEKLLKHATPMVALAVRTGMRIGELLALRWTDIANDQIHISRSLWWGPGGEKHEGAPKNHRARTIPLTPDAKAALEATPKRSVYVFSDEAGNPLTLHACKRPLWAVQEAAGLRKTGWHVLRHTFASHLVMKGASISAVQQLMGHSTIQMTMKYSHLSPDHLRSTIALLG